MNFTERPKVFTLYRGDPNILPASAKKFSGATFSARFSSTRPILIETILFYGREPQDGAVFQHQLDCRKLAMNMKSSVEEKWAAIELEIKESGHYQPWKHDSHLCVFTDKVEKQVNVAAYSPYHAFMVPFPTHVAVPADVIFDIRFQISGLNETIPFLALNTANNGTRKTFTFPECDTQITVHNESSGQCAGFTFAIDKYDGKSEEITEQEHVKRSREQEKSEYAKQLNID